MSLASHLLVAHPNLTDRMFTKSVVLVIEDTPTGSVGVVLNKPSTFSVSQFFRIKQGHNFESDDNIRCGGPVNSQAISMLHDDGWYSSNTYPLKHGLAVSSDEFMVEKMSMGNTPWRYRFFTGLSTWAPGQLQSEIEHAQSWLTMPADDSIVFEYDSEKQWETAVQQCTQQAVQAWF